MPNSPAVALDNLIKGIIADHEAASSNAEEARQMANTAVGRAVDAGRKLEKAKKRVPHGEWGKWIEANLPFSERTARDYMQVASNPAEISAIAKRRAPAVLTLDIALKELRKSSRKKSSNERSRERETPDTTVPSSLDDPAPETPAPTDTLGRPIPADCDKRDAIVMAFERRDELLDLARQVSRLKTAVVKSVKTDPLYTHLHGQSFGLECENLYGALKFAAPHTICPYCSGDGCKPCHEQGWVPKMVYESAPRELKQWRT